jgi:hypothetical protein
MENIIKYYDIDRGTYYFYDEEGKTLWFDDIKEYMDAVSKVENFKGFNQFLVDMFEEAKRSDLESEKKQRKQVNDYYEELVWRAREKGQGVGKMITLPRFDEEDKMIIRPEFEMFDLNKKEEEEGPTKEELELMREEGERKRMAEEDFNVWSGDED